LPLAAVGQVGGVDEGTADIFGILTKFAEWDSSYLPLTYKLGDRASKQSFPMASLDHPSSVAGVIDCDYRDDLGLDRHVLRGPVGHAFYIMTEGVANANTNVCAEGNRKRATGAANFKGIGVGIAEHVWFDAIKYYKRDTDFYGARKATLNAATNTYGLDSTVYRDIDMAWALVHVSKNNSTTFMDNKLDVDTQPEETPKSMPLVIRGHAHEGNATLENSYKIPISDVGRSYHFKLEAQCLSDTTCFFPTVQNCWGGYGGGLTLPLAEKGLGVYEGDTSSNDLNGSSRGCPSEIAQYNGYLVINIGSTCTLPNIDYILAVDYSSKG